MSRMVVEVAIALVWREGRLLITQRPKAVHLGGLWEFPGGKRRPDETFAQCAEREVFEEVGARVQAVTERDCIEHDYAERSVRLTPVDCNWLSGEPECRQVSASAWVLPRELPAYEFPAANAGLVESLIEGNQG